MSEIFNTDVEINGSEDKTQLLVQGALPQSQAMTEWRANSGDVSASLHPDGRLRSGSLDAGISENAQFAVHRHEDDVSRPTQGIRVLGLVKDALTSIVSWSVHELVLKGSKGVRAMHSALRVGLRNENSGTELTGGSVIAGQIEVVNEGGTSGSPIPEVTGLRVGLANQSSGAIDAARGVEIELVEEGWLYPEQMYVLHTTGAKSRIDDVLELHGNRLYSPAGESEVVKVFVKADGKLYARLGSGAEYLLTSAPVPEAGDETKFLRGDGKWAAPGTVSSAGVIAPTELNVSGSPVTTAGTMYLTWESQSGNQVLASPDGSSGMPSFRSLVADEIPEIPASRLNSALGLAQGGMNASLQSTGPGFLKQTTLGGNVSVSAIAGGDISGIDASRITTGTVFGARGGLGTYLSSAIGLLKHTGTVTSAQIAVLTASDVPNLPSVIITSGLLDSARLPIVVGDSGSGGTKGAVPAPAAGDAAAVKYLKASGAWTSPGVAANPVLSNLASVAVNESLVSDADDTADLGSSIKKWRQIFGNALTFEERTAPTTPASENIALYAKADKRMYYKADSGEEVGPLETTLLDVPLTSVVKQARVAELLYSAALGSAGRFDFNDIPQTYDDLFIRLIARSTANATTDTGQLLLNGVASNATDYHAQIAGAQNNAAIVSETTSAAISITTGTTSPAGAFTQHEITIPNYASTTYRKLAISRFGEHFTTDAVYNAGYVMIFETTNAITRVTLQPDGYPTDNFAVDSRIEVYGVKALNVVTDVTGSGSIVFAATASVTIANTTSETPLVGAGIGNATPQNNFLTPGRSVRIKASGYYSTDSSAGTLTLRLKLGSTTILATPSFTMANSVTNCLWTLEALVTCRTSGASGSVFGQAEVVLWSDEATDTAHQMAATSTVTVNTTLNQTINLTAQWGTADTDNAITMTNLVVEALM